eukprot:scaffold3173_cov242-Pinguiococcus_pyrenoidosus.AAC.3
MPLRRRHASIIASVSAGTTVAEHPAGIGLALQHPERQVPRRRRRGHCGALANRRTGLQEVVEAQRLAGGDARPREEATHVGAGGRGRQQRNEHRKSRR